MRPLHQFWPCLLVTAACSSDPPTVVQPPPVNPPTVTEFLVSASVVAPGERVTLRYSVTGADSVTITASPGAAIVERSTEASGEVMSDPITEVTQFLLRAVGAGGSAERALLVSVDHSRVAILGFDAVPNPTSINGSTTLTWATVGAERIRVLEGANELFASDTMVAAGSVDADVGQGPTTFTFEAIRGDVTVTKDVIVTTEPLPTIRRFVVTPTMFMQPPQTITVVWEVVSADTIRLERDGAPVATFPGTASGVLMIDVSTTTRFDLIAAGTSGTVRETRTVTGVAREGEPNDDFQHATDVSGGVATATISPAADLDWYQFVVPDGGSVWAETHDGRGGCSLDTTMRFYAPDGLTKLFEDADSGPLGGCSRIDPMVVEAARNLTAGTYFIEVRGNGTDSGPYTLTVRANPAMCGNGFIETATMEECDDGNTMAGDGCNVDCTVESGMRLTGPPSSNTLSGSIPVMGGADVYVLVMTAPGTVHAQLYAPSKPTCDYPGEVIDVALEDDSGVEIGRGDGGDIGRCSTIDPARATWASLPAGVYRIRVFAVDPAVMIDGYEIEVVTAAPACGNGVQEPGETCDDGNRTAGDGCDDACAFEGTLETESNNNFGSADTLGDAPVIAGGAIDPATDVDYFSFVIPAAGAGVEAWVTANSFEHCNLGGFAELTLYDTNGRSELASDRFNGPGGHCGRIDPDLAPAAAGLPAGRYYLEVESTVIPTVINSYFIHVNLVTTECGNGFLEGNEQCDDRNLADGDGCNATCNYEISRMVTPPGAFISLDMDPPGVFRVVQVDLDQAGQSIEAITSDNAGGCPLDTSLKLLDAGLNQLGEAQEGAVFPCAAFQPEFDPVPLDLAPGTYYLLLENDDLIGGTVQLDVRVVQPVCGDRMVQSMAGEVCDDGNANNGDGCSSACHLESSVIGEVEPNDARGGATNTSVTISSTVTMSAAIDPRGDKDYFAFVVPANTTATLVARVFGMLGDPFSCPGDTVLTLMSSSGTALTMDDNGNGICSVIDGNLDSAAAGLGPGIYYLLVEAWMDYDRIPQYFLDVSLQ